LNKVLIIAGIVVLAIAKAIIIKSALIDQPAYERCLSSSAGGIASNFNTIVPAGACGTDPINYFIIAWIVVAAGGVLLIYGLKAASPRKVWR
jgi:hypothetical protein